MTEMMNDEDFAVGLFCLQRGESHSKLPTFTSPYYDQCTLYYYANEFGMLKKHAEYLFVNEKPTIETQSHMSKYALCTQQKSTSFLVACLGWYLHTEKNVPLKGLSAFVHCYEYIKPYPYAKTVIKPSNIFNVTGAKNFTELREIIKNGVYFPVKQSNWTWEEIIVGERHGTSKGKS